jgi:hypothetical protein
MTGLPSTEEKVNIPREVLEDGKTVGQTAEEHGAHPNLILNRRKQLFEGALNIFEIKRPEISGQAAERKTYEAGKTGTNPLAPDGGRCGGTPPQRGAPEDREAGWRQGGDFPPLIPSNSRFIRACASPIEIPPA